MIDNYWIVSLRFFLVFLLCAAIKGQTLEPRFNEQDAWKILYAYQQSYPEKKILLKKQDGEFVLQLNGGLFYWLDSRLLPSDEREKAADFSPQSIYPYPLVLPTQPRFTALEEQRFRARLRKNEQQSNPPRHPAFLMNLHDIFNREQAYAATQVITFLGKKVRINRTLVPKLKEIEEELQTAMADNREIVNFFAQIKSISGYNWRQTSYFKSISYHSFGLAVDFIPQSWDKPVYWFWSRDLRADWYNIRYEERWQVPAKVVEIFESHGFIWGGKWLFFDNMHFEYRPELLWLQKSNISWPQRRSAKKHEEERP